MFSPGARFSPDARFVRRTRRARRARTVSVLVVAGALVAAAGCAPEASTPASSPAPSGASCAKASLPTKTAGKFTAGTDKPAYEPWFNDNNPSNGKGYESAVAYAVAEKLGYAQGDVDWVVVPFNSSFAPGEKNFDVDINQISITDARRKAVDFSSGYYTVAQAVVTVEGSKIADAKTIADLKGAKLGAQVGTTSYTAITQQIQPSAKPAVFDTNDVAVQSLKNKQVDGIVVDLPTAFYMVGAQLDGGQIVGQLPQAGSSPDQFGMVLDQGSQLTACVSQAVDALNSDGTLKKLQTQWLDNAGAPQLS